MIEKLGFLLAVARERLGAAIRIVRTGTRGVTWLEPLIEVETLAVSGMVR